MIKNLNIRVLARAAVWKRIEEVRRDRETERVPLMFLGKISSQALNAMDSHRNHQNIQILHTSFLSMTTFTLAV